MEETRKIENGKLRNSESGDANERFALDRVNAWLVGGCMAILLAGSGALEAQEPCRDQEIHRPQLPGMVEIDVSLVQGTPEQSPLPEWSKIEKLRSFYKRYASSQASCLIVEGTDTEVRMFLSRTSFEDDRAAQNTGRFAPEKAFQFYGASRVKVERADLDVSRQYAFPTAGPAPIAEIAEAEQLGVMIEDLAQLQLVTVPRFRYQQTAGSTSGGPSPDCFSVSHVTMVPSRIFDQPPPVAASEPSRLHLTLQARRRILEQIAHTVQWLERIETEEPACPGSPPQAYSGRQILSLNLTVRELVPDVDFVAQSLQFWKEVEERIEQLRAQDEGWKQEITQRP